MRKVVLLAIIFVTLIYGSATIYGGRGLFYTYDAITEDIGLLSTSFYLNTWRSHNQFFADAVLPNINYTPSKLLEIFFASTQDINAVIEIPRINNSRFSSELKTHLFGGKLSFPYIKVVKFGGLARYFWNRTGNYDNGLHWDALLNLRFKELLAGAPDLLVNYGESRSYRYFRGALEIIGEKGIIFVEAFSSCNKNTNNILEALKENLSIVPGIKLNISSHSYFNLGAKIENLYHNNLNYRIIAGFTIGGTFFRPTSTKTTIFVGNVYDANTNRKLAAEVRILDLPKLPSVKTQELTGIFKFTNVPLGLHTVMIYAPGYETLTVPVLLEASKINSYDFALKPLISFGIISGTIYDAVTNEPLEATVIMNNKEVQTDSVTGAFCIESVPCGVVSIEVKKPGYYPKRQTIIVGANRVNQIDFQLVKSHANGILTGTITDEVNNNPIRAKISFVNSELPPLYSDSLTGIFYSEVPATHYQMIVSAEGYIAKSLNVVIEKNKTTDLKIVLTPKENKAIFTGKVSCEVSHKPLYAKIIIGNMMSDTIYTDSLTGIFFTELPCGEYNIEVISDGYDSLKTTISLSQTEQKDFNFQLKPKE
ncbi:MAG: hypothetical protein NZ601_05520 [candidate division WOR-3 bacterium]|nr:hypothetical protein [candidate division WOR-3 bacterium]MCX7756732.1 hypothetical protein [candidate division WOR-3 bacterium]MDW7987416.1 carboxypeptidase regulatory-like domain-containing protein [candidate division WOR-3 bacterium]